MLFHQRMIMLQIVDTQWKDHLYALDHLKEGIGLRGYGQRDPLVEYKKESYNMFQALMDRIDEEILRWVFLYQPVAAPPGEEARTGAGRPARSRRRRGASGGRGGRPAAAARVREPELALAGARPLPRNLTFNDPGEAALRARAPPSGAARERRRRRRAAATPRCRRCAARARRSAATTPVPAGAARSTRSATGHEEA